MKKNTKKTFEKDRKYVKILGININSTKRDEVLTRVNNYLSHSLRFYIVTPNPELVLMSLGNRELKKALNEADMAIPDGIGLKYASKFLYGKDIEIVHGRKLFMDILADLNNKRGKVFFLGGKDDEAESAAVKLGRKFPNLKIQSLKGPLLYKNATPATEKSEKTEQKAIEKINKFAPDMLFVAYGNPKQEIWLNKNIGKLNVGGAMAVGGTLRYAGGLSKLPPKWMEDLELEWLWRLISEPERVGRIFNATVIFPWRIFRSKH